MERNKREIPRYVFEDMLFRRRLERNLGDELERLNNLLSQQIGLLQERKALMAEVHSAVQQRWQDEEQSTLIDSVERTEEEARDE